MPDHVFPEERMSNSSRAHTSLRIPLRSTRRACSRCMWIVGIVFALAVGDSRVAADDLDPRETGFQGLSQLVELARRESSRTESPDVLDLARLRPNDALLLVHPRGPLPVRDLSLFLRRGGRLALAADVGPSRELLSAFDIEHTAPREVDPVIKKTVALCPFMD